MAEAQKKGNKSIPISQQAIYEKIKAEKRRKIIEYSLKYIKKSLPLKYSSKKIKEIDYRNPK